MSAAAATATANACAPSNADDDLFSAFGSMARNEQLSSANVAALCRQFAAGLREHDGRMGVGARRLLRHGLIDTWLCGEISTWKVTALLSWADHSGRTALLPAMVALLPKKTRQSLLEHVLRYTPRLSLLRALLDCCPQLAQQMATVPLQLALLHLFCRGSQPNADTLRWLLDSLRFAPRHLCVAGNSPLSSLLFGQKYVSELAPDLFEMVRLLLQREPAMGRRKERGRFPLHHALSFARAEVPLDLVQLLIDTHPEGLQQKDDGGLLPVHCYVAEAARPTVAMLQLLSSGTGGGGAAATAAVTAAAGVAALRAQSRRGLTLLHLYCRRDVVDLDVLTFLCDACPSAPTQPDGKGRVPLMLLAEHSASLPAAQLLVERASSCAAHLDADGKSALLYVSPFTAAKAPLVEFLLGLHPAHVSLRPRNMMNALHTLLCDVQGVVPLESFRQLLRLNPKLLLRKDKWTNKMPIHQAVSLPLGRPEWGPDGLELLRLLLAPEHQPLLQLQALTNDGESTLHLLAKNALRPAGSMALLAGLHPVSLTAANRDGSTPTHYLLHSGCLPSVDEMRELIALAPECMAALDSKQRTPLHYLCATGGPPPDLATLELVVQSHPRAVTMTDSDGITPLMLLCQSSADVHCAQLLLDAADTLAPSAAAATADPASTPASSFHSSSSGAFIAAAQISKRGNTVLHYACACFRISVALLRLLLRLAPRAAHQLNQSYSSPLHWLCENSAVTPELLRLLLDATQLNDPDAVSPAALRLDYNGRRPLHVLMRNAQAGSSACAAAVVSSDLTIAAADVPNPAAESSSLLEMVQLLLTSASTAPSQHEGHDCDGWSILQLYFLRPGHRDIRVLQALLPTDPSPFPLLSGSNPIVSVLGAMAEAVVPLQVAELRLLLAPNGPLSASLLSETDVAAICAAPYVTTELLRLLLPATSRRIAASCSQASVALLTHTEQYLPRFKPLLSNPRLDLPMLQMLLAAFPADHVTGSADAWQCGWGSELGQARPTDWAPSSSSSSSSWAQCSALAALLANEWAMDSPHAIEMALALLERAPNEPTDFHDGRYWNWGASLDGSSNSNDGDDQAKGPQRHRKSYTVLAALLWRGDRSQRGRSASGALLPALPLLWTREDHSKDKEVAEDFHAFEDSPAALAEAAPPPSLPLLQALCALIPALLSIPNPHGQIALHQLAAHPSPAVVQELGAWVVEHTPVECLRLKDKSGISPVRALFSADCPSAQLLSLMLQKEPQIAQDQFEPGDESLLQVLCGSSIHSAELLRAVYEAYPPAMQIRDSEGRLPMHKLCKSSKLATVDEIAWAATVAPEAFISQDSQGRTLLMDACAHPSLTPPLLREIIKHCDAATVTALDPKGFSALHGLCASEAALTVDALQVLLAAPSGASLVSLGDSSWLPVHALVANRFVSRETVMLLVRANPASLHVVNRNRLTLFGQVSQRCGAFNVGEIVAALVEEDPRVLSAHAPFWKKLYSNESLGIDSQTTVRARWNVLQLLAAVLTTLQRPAHRVLQSSSTPVLPTAEAATVWTQLLRCTNKAGVDELFAQLLAVCPGLAFFVIDADSAPSRAAGPASLSVDSGTSGADRRRGSLLHASARAGSLAACRALVHAGASLMQKDPAGHTALSHCPQAMHPHVYAYLAAQVRLRSMFRGRFEIDTERGVHLSGHGKVKFAFDCSEGAQKSLQRQSNADNDISSVDTNTVSSTVGTVASGSLPSAAAPGQSIPVSASKPSRTPAVIKFFNDRTDFVRERDLHTRMSTAARGLYLPRLLASYDPVPGAAAGSDDSLPALCMEAGSESVRQQMERRAMGGTAGSAGAGRPGGSACWSAMDVLGVAASCVASLRFLHNGQGLVHADIKAENVVAFADDYRLIDFGSACDIGASMSLEYSAHYTPPEQAKRVLAVRQARQQAEDAVAAGGVGAAGRPLLAPIAATPLVVTPPLYADPSYDIWSLGVLLFTLRVGRPPFDSSTGDKETDTDMILDAIATATDKSILLLLKQQQRSRLVKLQDNEVSLLRHMLTVAPEERFTIDEVAAALEGMLHGLSATQKDKSLDRMVSAVRDVGVGMAQVGSQVKLGHKQMAKLDSGLQGVEQQVKQVKVGVKAVAAQVAVVADGVSGLAEGQQRIGQTLIQVHSLCAQLEAQAQATLRAIFDVAQGGDIDVPRLFTLLPEDSMGDGQQPLTAAQAKSLKAQFLSLCDDIAKGAARAQRRASPFAYYRLTFLCEAGDRGGGACSAHSGYCVRQPEPYLRRLLPVLRATNSILQCASVVGKAVGLPIASSLPFVSDFKEVALWSALDRWYAQDAQTDGSAGSSSGSSSSATAAIAPPSVAPPAMPESAYFDAYVAVKQLLEASGVEWRRGGSDLGSSSVPLGGLRLVRDRDDRARWVCRRHAQRFFPEGHEPKPGSAAALAIVAAVAAETEVAEGAGARGASGPSVPAVPPSAAASVDQQIERLKADNQKQKDDIQQLQAEIERLNARLAASSPEARTAKVAPDGSTATGRPLSIRVSPPTKDGEAEKKKDSACVVC